MSKTFAILTMSISLTACSHMMSDNARERSQNALTTIGILSVGAALLRWLGDECDGRWIRDSDGYKRFCIED